MQESTSDAKDLIHRLLSEDILTLKQARSELHSLLGKRPDKSTVYRWCLRGANGHKLESIKIGGQVITSKQALTRFFIAQQVVKKSA